MSLFINIVLTYLFFICFMFSGPYNRYPLKCLSLLVLSGLINDLLQ